MKGGWTQTYTGQQFWPLDPRPEHVDIRHVAHALSMLCRYGGSALRFYSVAEHSVLLSRYFTAPASKRWALMHDASEAYLVDVPRPIKQELGLYLPIEAMVMGAIVQRFALGPCPAEVHEADGRILADERAQNMAPCVAEWQDTGPPLGITLQLWTPAEAEIAFLEAFIDLFPGEPP